MLVAIDLGGTKTFIGAYESGKFKEVKKVMTPKDVPLWRFILNNLRNDFEAVSIATMGPLVLSEGKILNNPHLPEKDQDLALPLIKSLKRPVYVINDAVAGAWAEYKAQGCQNLVYIAFGTGIGVGVVVDGHLLLGKDGNAHEFGHVTLDMSSELSCGCGGKGHVEALLGGNNLPKFAKAHGINVKGAAEFFEKIYAGEERLYRAFEDTLLAFVSSVANAYDPECLVFGGGIFVKHKDLYMKVLAKLPNYKGLVVRAPKVKVSKYGELSALYGAAFLAVDKPEHWLSKLTYLKTVGHPLD